MLKVSINLDSQAREIVTKREVKVGTIFPIVVMIEEDGKEPVCDAFDTLILEILFNDLDPVLNVDPVQKPVAGKLAANSETTVDAFSRKRVRPVDIQEMPIAVYEKDMLVLEKTQLTLRRPTRDSIGRYKNSTGRAGLCDFGSPFKLSSKEGPVSVAMGKLGAGLKAVKAGTSNLVAVGIALLESTPICLNSAVSRVTVVDRL